MSRSKWHVLTFRVWTRILFVVPIVPCLIGWTGEQVLYLPRGKVTRAEGEVWLRRSGDVDPERLLKEEMLVSGDDIITSIKGRSECTHSLASYLQVADNSTVRAVKIDATELLFHVEKGKTFAIISSVRKKCPLIIETPAAELQLSKKGRYLKRVTDGVG